MLQVKLWKLKIWNKDAITKDIKVVLNWFINIEVFKVDGCVYKTKVTYLQHLKVVYEDSVIMQSILQSFALQNSSLNFKSTKHENVTHFING